MIKEDEYMIPFVKGVLVRLKRVNTLVHVYLFMVSVANAFVRFVLNVFVYPVLPLKPAKVVISSFYGRGYGDNGKYIAEAMQTSNLECDIVWLFRKNNSKEIAFPEFIRVVNYNSLRGFYELITAKVWIDNCRKGLFAFKRPGQYYIQTWHASLSIKKIEEDVAEVLPPAYVYRAIRDSRMCDVVLAGSKFHYELFKKAFWYDGEVMKSGTPRCDMLFAKNTHLSEKVFNWFGLPSNCHLVLYAPTFRNSHQFNYELGFAEILAALERKFGGDWRFLLRLHPNVAESSDGIMYNSKLLNASYYDDMQELVSVSDCLITDYSSVMFDMLLLKKPCFIHAVDYSVYKNMERGLYFDLSQLPIPFSANMNQLLNNIFEFNNSDYLRKVSSFMDDIEPYEDGAASERVAQRIREVIES